MLLLDTPALDARTAVAHDQLAPLAQSLVDDLTPLVGRELYFPAEKALLSREGGRCARDGSLLEFHPLNRHAHRCPVCGTVYQGELHERFWIYWYQLWLAERAVHAALLAQLGLGEQFATLAASILDGYAERYLTYPNVDNVLGPTRLFFSTYLESIWLLNVCIATDLLASRDSRLVSRVLDRIVEPSRDIIAQYDEGNSNRQVWNDAALFAAARMLDDERCAEDAVYGASGILTHLSDGLLPDGTWYEGENYHLFAHRGLWYGVQMAERAGLELPEALVDRFQRGFAAPFATALPDLTLPSRRDSQYAISLRQWRITEHCELGVARRPDDALLAALRELYAPQTPELARHPEARARSSADVERNAPPAALTRADLNWRALMFALPTLPPLRTATPRSALLDAQGVAVFRREAGYVYAALDYGHSGGGHGHPDRLNLILATKRLRWLDDFGTASYVDPSLHWYRSTLAHNAPLVDGHSQQPVHGELLAYDERHDVGWIVARAEDIAPGVSVSRTLIMMAGYAVDVVHWDGAVATIDLPLHADLEVVDPTAEITPGALTGGSEQEDGFDFVRDATRQAFPAEEVVRARAASGDASLDVFAACTADTEWWRVTAPGAPGSGDHTFRVLRTRAGSGEHRLVWSWSGNVHRVRFDDGIHITLGDGTRHYHVPLDDGWRIDVDSGDSRDVIELGGLVERDAGVPVEHHRTGVDAVITLGEAGHPTTVALDEQHYRRSEQNWRDAGGPRAQVSLAVRADGLHIMVDVPHSDRTFVTPGTVNPYDNEPAEINGDGVQLYVRGANEKIRGWVLVPIPETTDVQQRPIDAWESSPAPLVHWRPTSDGYTMEIVLLGEVPEALDVVVNEKPRGRTRRRGQLLLSGARGEFVYLRGDRHDPDRLVRLQLTNV
jgi:hypothetical protein